MKRRLRLLAFAALAGAAAWIVASVLVVARATRRARPRCAEPLPAVLAGRAEDVLLATSDGERLGAWFVPARREGAASVLLLHGRGGTRASRLPAGRVFEDSGCALFLLTLRAHGDSTGEREDFGWSARHDVTAAVEWLERRRPDAPVVVCGASLGAAAAVFAATELGERVDGYVLECLYRDLDSATSHRTELYLPPLLDRIAHAGLLVAADFVLPRWRDIAPVEAIAGVPVSVPVLVLAGALDRHATIEDAQDLHARVASHAELVVLDGAAHDRLAESAPHAYGTAVLALVGRAEARTAGALVHGR